MFHHEDILSRLQRGEKQRFIQDALGVSPKSITTVRTVATFQGWLDPGSTLPDAETLDAAVREYKAQGAAQRGAASPTVSQVEPYRDLVTKWANEGMEAKTIWAARVRNHDFQGSYSSVRRFVRRIA